MRRIQRARPEQYGIRLFTVSEPPILAHNLAEDIEMFVAYSRYPTHEFSLVSVLHASSRTLCFVSNRIVLISLQG